jgi:hypothetical protein
MVFVIYIETVLYHKKLLEACEWIDIKNDTIKLHLDILHKCIEDKGFKDSFQLDCALSLACIYSKSQFPEDR